MFRDFKPYNIIAFIILAPLLYVLSAGPIIKIDRMLGLASWGIPSTPVLTFYWPLSWFGDHVPPVGTMLEAYVKFWLSF